MLRSHKVPRASNCSAELERIHYFVSQLLQPPFTKNNRFWRADVNANRQIPLTYLPLMCFLKRTAELSLLGQSWSLSFLFSVLYGLYNSLKKLMFWFYSVFFPSELFLFIQLLSFCRWHFHSSDVINCWSRNVW